MSDNEKPMAGGASSPKTSSGIESQIAILSQLSTISISETSLSELLVQALSSKEDPAQEINHLKSVVCSLALAYTDKCSRYEESKTRIEDLMIRLQTKDIDTLTENVTLKVERTMLIKDLDTVKEELKLSKDMLIAREYIVSIELQIFPIWLFETKLNRMWKWIVVLSLASTVLSHVIKKRITNSNKSIEDVARAIVNAYGTVSDVEAHPIEALEGLKNPNWVRLFERMKISNLSEQKCLRIVLEIPSDTEKEQFFIDRVNEKNTDPGRPSYSRAAKQSAKKENDEKVETDSQSEDETLSDYIFEIEFGSSPIDKNRVQSMFGAYASDVREVVVVKDQRGKSTGQSFVLIKFLKKDKHDEIMKMVKGRQIVRNITSRFSSQ